MVSFYEVDAYFKQKALVWSRTDGSAETHIRRLGRRGLAGELSSDPAFAPVVCAYVHQVSELQLRSEIARSLESLVSIVFGVPLVGTLDVVIGAIADACGFKTIGDKLIEAALAPLVIIGEIVADALNSVNSKK